MTRMPALLAVLLLLAPAARAEDEIELKGLDVYRSNSLTADSVRQALGPRLEAFLRLRGETRNESKNAERARVQLEGEVMKLGPVAFARIHYGQYVTSSERSAYLVLDIVDSKDAATRLAFRTAPTGSVDDPGGLLADWKAYGELGRSLLREGKLSTDHNECPAHYCLWGSPTPELGDFERRFLSKVPTHAGALLQMIRTDADPAKRAAALYVLAYSTDSKLYAETVTTALSDPGEEVRSAALQVLSDIALYRKTVVLDVRRIIPALDDPLTSIRAKAETVLVGLTDNPSYRPYVLSKGTPYLLGLLRLHEPSNHDLAFTLLSLLSKETYGRRDYKSWEAWVAGQAAVSTNTAPSPPTK